MENLFADGDAAMYDYYDVIGCHETSSVEQILTEYKARALACHPDKNSGKPCATEEFARLQVAKDVLSDPEKRKDYDLWRRSGIKIPYTKWRLMKDSIKMSMHWVVKKEDPMIECADPKTEVAKANEYLSRDHHEEMRRKFRNYEI